ncbi:hypothetical protein J7643_10175 [bacterium]|nr:hypothetical protein [bacterium]
MSESLVRMGVLLTAVGLTALLRALVMRRNAAFFARLESRPLLDTASWLLLPAIAYAILYRLGYYRDPFVPATTLLVIGLVMTVMRRRRQAS